MRLPGREQRALDRIEQALAAEDPRLGVRFAFFTVLTRHEAIPGTEQAPGRRQRFLRRALLPPLLAAMLAASWLTPSGQACPAGLTMAAHALSSLRHATRCQSGPAIRPDTMPAH